MIIPWLSLIIWLPTLAALLIAFLPRTWVRLIQALAVGAGAASAVLSLRVFLEGLADTEALARFELVRALPWLESVGIQYKVGVDGLSISMMLLTGLVSLAALWMSVSIDKRQKEYFVLCLLAITGVYGVFASIDLFFFIIFYELASIPMYFLVGIWGSDKIGSGRPIYRERAATKLLLYLQLGGGLVLLGILALYFATGAKTFDLDVLLQTARLSAEHQKVIFLLFFFGFAIEAGLVPLHTWLPEGHSSAPTPLSMLLAGVLLKMGGYGFIRFSIPMFPEASALFAPLVFALSVIAIVYTSLVALMQEDMKKLIAYSSVAHMGFVTMGIFAMNQEGVQGAIFQMLSHGLVSGALFLCVGVIYDRMHTREIDAYGGLVNNMPKYATVFLIFTMANVGLPGTSGFVGEFLTMLGVFRVNTWVAFFAATGVILSAAYALWLYRRVIFGALTKDSLKNLLDLSPREKAIVYPLVVLVIFFGVYPAPVFDATSASVKALVTNVTASIGSAQTAAAN